MSKREGIGVSEDYVCDAAAERRFLTTTIMMSTEK